MSERYLVMFEVEEGEWMYASAENPFTYDSKPLIFDTKGEAHAHSLRYNTGIIVEQSGTNPRAAIRESIRKGI
tara:strand:- start:258 stop:476 length:219 start_codon:yes stop_codon:yes gene_type:complete